MVKAIDIPSDDVYWIGSDLHCKTPAALATALDTLRYLDYSLWDMRNLMLQRGKTPEDLEHDGAALWNASLYSAAQKCKCLSCGSYILRMGIQTHGHTCEACGEVTYLELTRGSVIKFVFIGEEYYSSLEPYLQMRVWRWDVENGWLYLYPEFRIGSLSVMGPQQAEAYLKEHPGKWEAVEEGDVQLIRVRHFLRRGVSDPEHPEEAIEVRDKWGDYSNYQDVWVWDGREYSEYDPAFPLPKSVSIYEDWH